MAPAQFREPAEAAVGGDPLASRLDGECGEIGVGNQIAFRARPDAETGEDRPVPRSGSYRHAVRLGSQLLGEADGKIDRGWAGEDPRVGDDPQEATENDVGHAA